MVLEVAANNSVCVGRDGGCGGCGCSAEQHCWWEALREGFELPWRLLVLCELLLGLGNGRGGGGGERVVVELEGLTQLLSEWLMMLLLLLLKEMLLDELEALEVLFIRVLLLLLLQLLVVLQAKSAPNQRIRVVLHLALKRVRVPAANIHTHQYILHAIHVVPAVPFVAIARIAKRGRRRGGRASCEGC